MEAAFCVETLENALAHHVKPDIFNTDQRSQFTGQAFTGVLANNDIAISMDGKGAWRDNVLVERLWHSVKYEEVYLRAYDSVSEARASIGHYLVNPSDRIIDKTVVIAFISATAAEISVIVIASIKKIK